MRFAIVCSVLLFLGPIAATLGYKQYQRYQEQQATQRQAGEWHARGEVLFFNASWCGPCRQMKPIVSRMRAEG